MLTNIHNMDKKGKTDTTHLQLVVSNSGIIELPVHDDGDGLLMVIQDSDLPWGKFTRSYPIRVINPDSIRGKHAHLKCNQVIFCLEGGFDLVLDDGKVQQTILMSDKTWQQGIILGAGLWHTMQNFTPGCLMVVYAEDHYDSNDYVRDYGEFLRLVEHGMWDSLV